MEELATLIKIMEIQLYSAKNNLNNVILSDVKGQPLFGKGIQYQHSKLWKHGKDIFSQKLPC